MLDEAIQTKIWNKLIINANQFVKFRSLLKYKMRLKSFDNVRNEVCADV